MTYTARAFALELFKVGVGPHIHKAARAEWALHWASEQGLAFDTTQEHLDAVCALVLACEAAKLDDLRLFTDATFGVWTPVALEVMRIGLFGEAPRSPMTQSNTPPMRQFPRSSMPIQGPPRVLRRQGSAADIGTRVHKAMHDLALMDHPVALQTHDHIELPRKKLDEPLQQQIKAIMDDFQKAVKDKPLNLKWLTFESAK